MKLEQLKKNFLYMPSDEQRAFFIKYTERRSKDLIETTVVKTTKNKSGTAGNKVTVSIEAFELLKKLGLTK